MESTSKRATTSSVRYTFSDDDEQEPEGGKSQKNAGKKKTGKRKTSVCKICNKRYKDPRHMEVHIETKDYMCDVCDASFKTSRYLYRHRKVVHAPASHECEFCGRRFSLASTLEQHRLVHTGEKPHKCEVCGKCFRATYSLNTHRLLHTNEKPYKCQYCPYACRDSSTLRRHHERHTGTLQTYQCPDCGNKYDNKSKLKTHMLERHFADVKLVPCAQCDRKYKSDVALKKHIRMVHERAFKAKCEVCGMEIASRYNMSTHLRKHLQVRPYKCKYKSCQKRFKNMGALKIHSRIHKPDEQFPCDVCGRLFTRRHRLNTHMRQHGDDSKWHTRFKVLFCDYCGISQRKHSRIHKPDGQFPCDVCGRLFTRRHRLNTHMRQHGDDSKWHTRFKVLFCDYCGISFDNKPCLVRHMLKHIRHRNTYVCDVCRYVTHRKLSIEKHMKYGHGDEDDVQCKICDRSYKLHAYLITHYYSQHGVRYKTVGAIKLETSVTIKQEPLEPIPDAEVELEDVQKEESLANIITDVALDRDATDISYSKSVLKEDIYRSITAGNFSTTPNTFRKKLQGRAAFFDEQNSLYARKEKDVKKRIKKLLSRVRQKKLTRVLERARQQYNERIRAITNKDKENNLKIKYVNINQANNNKIDKNDDRNDFKTENVNSKPSHANNLELDRDSDIKNDETDINSVEMLKHIVNDNKLDSNIIDDRSVDDTSFINDSAINRDSDMANIYEDLLDIEDNPVGNITNTENKDTNSDIRNDCNATDSANLNYNNSNRNKEDDFQANPEENVTDLENKVNEDIEELNLNQELAKYSASNDENNVNGGNNEINEPENSELSDQDLNAAESDDTGNNNVSDSIVNDDKESHVEGKRGKNVKLKINTHQCYICYKLYETKQKLLEHCQVHFDVCSDISLKKCPLCNYVTKLNITRHIKLVHGISIKLPYHRVNDKHKNSKDASRYFYDINDKVVKEIEIIPSVRNLNKIAYVKIDKNNRINKDLSVAKTKLVKKSGEWVVEHENINLSKVNNEFILPEFDKKEIKKVKFVGDQYLDVIKALGRLATRHKAKMLYPCNGCDKLCRTFAALKLHSRRHETNPKPFKKKVWKHKLKGVENKVVKTSNIRKKDALERVRQAKPKPIENKHKCDKTLMDFYEKNVKGADIEFWQFLKIYNRMNKEHADNLKDLKETNEFGDYTTEESPPIDNEETVNEEQSPPIDNVKTVIEEQSIINKAKAKLKPRFARSILSKEEKLRRAQIKDQLRRKITAKE